uniref:Uncharacterized protein n=2 Tax=Oryza TaxID=4527 RepID=A0A0E0R0H1_ORYRU
MVRRPIRPLAQLRPSRSRPRRSKWRDGSLCTGLRSAVAELERGGGEEMERSRAAAVFGGVCWLPVYGRQCEGRRGAALNVDIATVPGSWFGWGGKTDFG